MSFFMSADYSLSTKVMEIIYFIIGLLCIYCGVKNLKDKENPEPMGTFIFWAVLGVVLALGRWLPSLVSGILVVVMCIPAILKKVKKGAVSAATKAETEATYEKIGMKIFVPTLSIGMRRHLRHHRPGHRPVRPERRGSGCSRGHHPADDHEPRQQALHLPERFRAHAVHRGPPVHAAHAAGLPWLRLHRCRCRRCDL